MSELFLSVVLLAVSCAALVTLVLMKWFAPKQPLQSKSVEQVTMTPNTVKPNTVKSQAMRPQAIRPNTVKPQVMKPHARNSQAIRPRNPHTKSRTRRLEDLFAYPGTSHLVEKVYTPNGPVKDDSSCLTSNTEPAVIVSYSSQNSQLYPTPVLVQSATVFSPGAILLTDDVPNTIGGARFKPNNPGSFWSLSFTWQKEKVNTNNHDGDAFWVTIYADPDEFAFNPKQGYCIQLQKMYYDSGLIVPNLSVMIDGLVIYTADLQGVNDDVVRVNVDFADGQLLISMDNQQVYNNMDPNLSDRDSFLHCEADLVFGAICGANSAKHYVQEITFQTF